MRELRTGLWHWRTRHPEWRDGEPWDPAVSSYAYDDGERLLLFDPLGVPAEIESLAAEREAAIVLTAPWHERDAEQLVQRLGLPVHTPQPDTAEDLMRDWGITAEQAGDGSPDVVWLLKEGRGEAHLFRSGDRPLGLQAYEGHKRNDLMLWIEGHRALVVGDTLADFGEGIAVNTRWLLKGDTRERMLEHLRPILDLPVELVLPSHGEPVGRDALERALRE